MDKEKHKKIILLTAEGYTAKAIGENLGLSKRTIERHLERLKDSYGAKNASNLVAIAFRKKIIS